MKLRIYIAIVAMMVNGGLYRIEYAGRAGIYRE
jgi:hypothetical protein